MNQRLKMGWKIVGFSAVMIPSIAAAVTHTVTAQVSFARGLSATMMEQADFGVLKATIPAKYTLSTAGIVSIAGQTTQPSHGSKAGGIIISGPATQNMDIIVDQYTKGNGIVPSNAYCSYDNADAMPCMLSGQAAPGAGKVLRIGLDIALTGYAHPANHNMPGFEVEMRYY